ncbi:MAG: D-tyrosyl-tRNA(Tyr) deacylase [Deltaproteobacteria bacterium]|nr:D-tyrosyl-tRNA(Tyr) deacylase [Deltaproteobacteria bacterium]
MRAVIQRVSQASVQVAGEEVGAIGPGLLVYLGVARGDGERDLAYLEKKILGLRVFEDAAGRMQHHVVDLGGGVLLVSQFTLFGDVRRGRRPSFTEAAEPELADTLYTQLRERLAASVPVQSGVFRAHMDVRARVDGPVTILVDSRKLF